MKKLGMAIIATSIVCLGAASTIEAAPQTVELDTHLQGSPDSAGPVATPAPLTAGASYYVIVSGTMSIWPASQWSLSGRMCGEPEELPMFESPGALNGPVGWDAETVFAVPPYVNFYTFPCTASEIPFLSTEHTRVGFELSISGSSGFMHAVPVGGAPSTPTADHTYTYAVTGTGQPASFRFIDDPVSDDYGVFMIKVLTAAECAAVNCEGAAIAASKEASSTTPSSAVTTADLGGKGEVKSSKIVKLPAKCYSLRHFPIHFRVPRGVVIDHVVEYINGHLVHSFSKSVTADIVRAGVNLHGLPLGTFTLELRVTTSRGEVLRTIRTYHTCVPGKRQPPKKSHKG
jgi:hypothetical protein